MILALKGARRDQWALMTKMEMNSIGLLELGAPTHRFCHDLQLFATARWQGFPCDAPKTPNMLEKQLLFMHVAMPSHRNYNCLNDFRNTYQNHGVFFYCRKCKLHWETMVFLSAVALS